jgi:hypothetical protein
MTLTLAIDAVKWYYQSTADGLKTLIDKAGLNQIIQESKER